MRFAKMPDEPAEAPALPAPAAPALSKGAESSRSSEGSSSDSGSSDSEEERATRLAELQEQVRARVTPAWLRSRPMLGVSPGTGAGGPSPASGREGRAEHRCPCVAAAGLALGFGLSLVRDGAPQLKKGDIISSPRRCSSWWPLGAHVGGRPWNEKCVKRLARYQVCRHYLRW